MRRLPFSRSEYQTAQSLVGPRRIAPCAAGGYQKPLQPMPQWSKTVPNEGVSPADAGLFKQLAKDKNKVLDGILTALTNTGHLFVFHRHLLLFGGPRTLAGRGCGPPPRCLANSAVRGEYSDDASVTPKFPKKSRIEFPGVVAGVTGASSAVWLAVKTLVVLKHLVLPDSKHGIQDMGGASCQLPTCLPFGAKRTFGV